MKSFILLSSLSIAFGLSAIQANAQQSASPPATPIDVSAFNELVKGAKWDDAAAWVDAALKESPDSTRLLSLSLQLANQTIRSQPEASEKRFSGLIDKWCSSESLTAESARNLSMATNTASMMLMQKDRNPEAIALVERSLKTVSNAGETVRAVRRDLESNLARIYSRAGKSEDALKLMRSSVESVKLGFEQGTEDLRELVRVTNTFSGMFDDTNTEEVSDRVKYAESLVLKRLDSNSAQLNDLSAYVSLRSSQLSQLIYSDPARGIELAKELQSRLDVFSVPTDANELRQFESFGKSLKQTLARLESSMVRERLVGTAAPEYDPQSFVGMAPTSLAELKGKVVLLDFWAVWCGPCIATFPHLRDWHDAYAEKGFAVLGMTSDQGYVWDETKEMAVRGTDVSHEQELEMLASFRKHHNLRHGFVLTPKGSEYNKQLAVSGIPQAVLLDKQGVIRMIKVGSGAKNAKDLEEAIKKLLAEDTKPAEPGNKPNAGVGATQ